MCKELRQELDIGKQAATMLIEHMNNMGAAWAEIPITLNGTDYKVTVERTKE